MSEQLMSKAEVLDAMKRGHNDFVMIVFDLDEAKMTAAGPYPDSDWTLKDTLAHLTACTQDMISRLPGHQPIPFPVEAKAGESWDSQVERSNEYYYQRDKDKPMAQVGTEFDITYRQAVGAVEALSEGQVADRAVQELIAGNTYEHYAEHLGYIADWLAQQDATPLRNKAELLAAMQQGHDKLLAALDGLSDAQMTTPGPNPHSNWTVKDTLAHLAAWMQAMVKRLPGGAGKPFPFEEQAGEDHDHFVERVNEYWYQRDKDKSLAEVRDEFEQAYRQLADAVASLSDAQVADRAIQYRVEGNSFGHFEEHLGYIGDWLKQQEQPHISKADMLARMAAGRDELLAAISNLSDTQMTSPGLYPDSDWTVKDTLAHLAAWMRAMAVLMPDGASKPYPFEEQPDESEDHFFERVNDYWYERDKDKPLSEVRSEFEAAYQQQFAAMEALSDEQAVEPTHIKEHLGFISDWLKQQAQA